MSRGSSRELHSPLHWIRSGSVVVGPKYTEAQHPLSGSTRLVPVQTEAAQRRIKGSERRFGFTLWCFCVKRGSRVRYVG